MASSLVARAMGKRPAPPQGDAAEESREQTLWRGATRKPGELHTELPDSLKRAKVDREPPLEAEVVRRGRPQEVPVDIHVAAALKPVDRARWLTRALEGLAREAARPSDVYDVVTHKRFAAGVTPALARTMMEELRKQAGAFPERLRQSILLGGFPLAEAACAVGSGKADAEAPSRTAEEIMARCVDFVRRNEEVIAKVHEMEARTFQVELQRSSLQQVWGLTWARAAFNAQRRVLEAVVPDSPAGLLNRLRAEAGERPMKPGDELIALNGTRGWEAMGRIRELLSAKLTFVANPTDGQGSEAAGADNAGRPSKSKEAYLPPLFSKGGYALDAGSGWKGHVGGQWLFNQAEDVYFHVPTGGLFIEDPATPGTVVNLSVQAGEAGGAASSEAPAHVPPSAPQKGPQQQQQQQQQPARLRGRMRWFSRAKGFGFISPWPGEGSAASGGPAGCGAVPEEDIFVHHRQLLPEGEAAAAEPPPMLPGMPVTYTVGRQDDGRPCAEGVRAEADLAELCNSGCSLGSDARCIEQAAVELRGHDGQPAAGFFAGLATGRRGMGGAEYVALHLVRDLVACLQGREQGGEKGARAALLAAFRQTQHGFLQYAQRLSENSAGRWLAQEAAACAALVFGPEADGRPRALVTCVGGGRAVVGRRDGTVSAVLGELPGADEEAARAAKKRIAEDNLKVFERGLKGPAISFPPLFGSGSRSTPEGFGAHNWTEKDGGAAGLALEIHGHALDWEEDAVLVLGSSAAWEALPEDEEVVGLALEGIQEPGPGRPTDRAARRVMEALRPVRAARRETPQDVGITVLRLSWCTVEGEELPGEACLEEASSAAATVGAGGEDAAAPAAARSGDMDDMFAEATPAEATPQEAERALEVKDSDEEPAAEPSKEPPRKVPTRMAPPLRFAPPLGKAASAAAAAPTQGPASMDDMFASFCKEIDGMR
uniref:PPM-type phosphatase domain-containing protein n=1 Tax=Alexandrium monilatum TaxID=311494 RepID=A0A7S4WJI2_9DINO